jgi:hypothetical protein
MALLFVWASFYTQSVESLETTYYNLDKNRRFHEINIDSLKSILEVKAGHIDQAKSENKPESQIKQLMSEAVVISSAIEDNQTEIKKISEKLSQIEQNLIKIYTIKIDSLKKIKVANSGEDIEWQILDYTYRKFFISPGASELSFNPQKMLAVTKEVKDSDLVREYLIEAISEVDSQVIIVSSLHDEINTIYRLQQQAGEFFDDVEMDQDFRSYSFEPSRSYQYDKNMESTTFQGVLNTNQASSNTMLYRQLFHIIQNPSEGFPIYPNEKHMTLDEYKKMLEDLLKYLNSYRDVLHDTIKQMK